MKDFELNLPQGPLIYEWQLIFPDTGNGENSTENLNMTYILFLEYLYFII